ncbi:TonB-dependent receptor [Mesoterricola sediminis]|uniref:TonB-dependent receptor n=1 Tax=Mesoterricola sediminis TaxID=2927980 RepID=UPI001FAFDDF3|nr:TonB-dependent receptor [Mesoterricola sediminis]
MILLSSLACAVVATAQTSTTSGALRGNVKSKKGSAVQGASVSIRNLDTGFTRTISTDGRGDYQFPFLPVGSYELIVTSPGLKTAKDSNVRVGLGQTATQNFSLDSAEASAVVEVVGVTSNVDTAQINTQTAINQEIIDAVPLVSRNFTDLVQLTPGAATNSEGYRTTVEGARGIQNNLQIDGASYNSKFNSEQRGGTRIPFTFGADSIKELQVITNSFDAQYGDAVGAVVNAVTKSGTNEFGGMAFVMFKPNSMVARVKPVPWDPKNSINSLEARTRDYQQAQGGFNFGGPIIKDKLHFFINVEGTRLREGSVPAFGVDSSATSGNAITDFNKFFGTGGMGALLTTAPGTTLAQEAGRPWTDEQKNLVFMGRLDWTINEAHRATLRINSQNYKGLNDIYPGTRRYDVAWSGQSTMEYTSLSTVLEVNSILPHNILNEFRVQYATEDRPTTPNSTTCAPVRIAQIGGSYSINAGQYYIDPRNTKEFTTQIIDNVTYMTGDWTFKAGVDLQRIHMKNRYLPSQNGNWSFTTYAAANNWFAGTLSGTGVSYTQGWSPLDGVSDFTEDYFAGYMQAQYTGLLDKRLMLSLGFRATNEHWSDNPNPNPKLQGLDHQPDDHSVDPRFGFSFDVFGDARTVIRGGYGHFSISNPGQTASGAIMYNGLNLLSYSVSSSNSNYLPYFLGTGILSPSSRWSGSLSQPGSLTALSRAELGTLPQDAVTVAVIDPNAKMTQARAMSLGVEQDLGNGYTVGLKATYKKFYNLQYAVNINLAQYADGSTSTLSGAIYNDGYASTWNHWSNKTSDRPYTAVVRGRQLDLSGFGDVILSKYDGEGRYKSLVLEVSKKSSEGWGFQGSLTFSKAEDNNSNERATLTSTGSSGPLTENPGDPLSSYTLSDNDHRFRAVLAWWAPKVWGIKFSGTTSFTTGRPYTAYWYNDINGDGKYIDTVNGRNTFRQPSAKTFDLRIERGFRITKRFSVDAIIGVFNVFNWANQYTSQTTYATSPQTVDSATDSYRPNFGKIDRADKNSREVQFTLKTRF